ncbi:MAG: hypothetical protein ABMB14_19205 [Myxococcota bacterium]
MSSPFRRWRAAVVIPLVAVPVVASAGWPLGSRIDHSVVVDLTPEGFSSLQTLAGSLVPPQIDLPPFAAADSSGCVFGACLYSYDLFIDGMFVQVSIDSLDLAPAAGNVLNLTANATINVNSAADPALLDIVAELAYIEVVDDSCDLYVDPITLSISGPIQLSLLPDDAGVDVDGDGTPDTKRLDVVIPPVAWSWDATGDDIEFTNCGLADVINTVNEVTGFFGLDLYDLILGMVEPQIDTVVNDLPAELEPLLEDTFASLTISEEIDLLGVPLGLTLWPESLSTTADGMRVELSSVTDVPTHPCVAQYGIPDSVATASTLPAIGAAPPGLPFVPHAGAVIDDDFVNQVLYGVWSGGLLCYEISSESDDLDLPIPIDTGLLGLMAPGVFDPLFPETAPMALVTAPRVPPVVDPAGPDDVDVAIDDLGLGFFVELDGRKTRLMNIDLQVEAGLDLAFDPATGNLAFGIDLGEGAITPTVTVNEFAPDSSAAIATSFGAVFDTLVGPLLGGLLADASFPIPSIEGLGITDMAVQSAGLSDEMLGAYVSTGLVTYPALGCDEEGGCTSGCDSGCSTGGPGGLGPARLSPIWFTLASVALRRRRRDA